MRAVEFTAELRGSDTLTIPPEVVSQLPVKGIARVIVLTEEAPDADAEWRAASYEHFLADDAPEDAIYDGLR